MFDRLNSKNLTAKQLVLLGVVELLLGYLLGSRALETGSLIEWTGTIVITILGLRSFVLAALTQRKGKA